MKHVLYFLEHVYFKKFMKTTQTKTEIDKNDEIIKNIEAFNALFLSNLDKELPNDWYLLIETKSQKKTEGADQYRKKESTHEIIAVYENLKTLKNICFKLANISISTIGFFSQIVLLNSKIVQLTPEDLAISPQSITDRVTHGKETTVLSIVNLKPNESSDMFIKLICYLFFGDAFGADSVISISFIRVALNLQISITYSLFDIECNNKIISSIYSFLYMNGYIKDNEIETNPLIDMSMNKAYESHFGIQTQNKLSPKNTFDSAFTLYKKEEDK